MKQVMIILLTTFLVSGCATTPISKLTLVEWSNDVVLQKSAITLVEDYLKDQTTGGENSSSFFGAHTWGGAKSFLNLHEWKITLAPSTKLFDTMPGIYCRLKLENRAGGVSWATYGFLIDYDKTLREAGDKYSGLRIYTVTEI